MFEFQCLQVAIFESTKKTYMHVSICVTELTTRTKNGRHKSDLMSEKMTFQKVFDSKKLEKNVSECIRNIILTVTVHVINYLEHVRNVSRTFPHLKNIAPAARQKFSMKSL